MFDPKIISHYVKALGLVFYADHFDRLVRAFPDLPNVWAVGGDDFGKVGAIHLGNGPGLGYQFVDVGLDGRDDAPHDAVVAQVADEGASVDVGKNRDLELLEILFGNLLRAPIGADLGK